MFYSRNIYSLIKAHLKEPQVTVITGMRRTGKTFLLKQLLADIPSKNKIFFDMEKLSDREIFEIKNYDNILNYLTSQGINLKEQIYIALDEIQYIKNLPSVIKYLYDHYKIKFIVTGSVSYYLKNYFSESLSGRKRIFELFPLNFNEYLVFKNIRHSDNEIFLKNNFNSNIYQTFSQSYEEYIKYGGFPEVVLAQSHEQKKSLLKDIYSSYIEVDVRKFSDFRKIYKLKELLKLLCSRVGNKIDVSKLSVSTDLSPITVNEYLDFFEQTYLIFRLPVYTNSIDKEISKAKKIYFCDNGLLNILAELNSGSQFENTVFNQLKFYGQVNYYSLKTGKEIDFILNKDIAFEVKESPMDWDRKNLQRLTKSAGLKKSYLIGRYESKNFSDYIWGGDIR